MANALQLSDILAVWDGKKSGSGYRGTCPGHGGDNKTALEITEKNGKLEYHCRTRDCSPEQILRALGLWQEPTANTKHTNGQQKTTKKPSTAKQRPPASEPKEITEARHRAAKEIFHLLTDPQHIPNSTLEAFGQHLDHIHQLHQELVAEHGDVPRLWAVMRQDPRLARLVAEVDQLVRTQGGDPTPYSDQFNAEAFVAAHGANIHYCERWQRWVTWDGQRWRVDEHGQVMRWAKATIKDLATQLPTIQGEAETKAFLAHIKRSLSRRSLADSVYLAQSEPGIPVAPEMFDRDPWLFNVQNGTIDLRTGLKHAHRRSDLLMKLSPVAYDDTATCPLWEKSLLEMYAGDVDLIRFDQKATGYTLTGNTREQALFICHGVGNNGKSTKLSIMREFMGEGEYALRTNLKAFTESTAHHQPSSIEYYIAKLQNVRFAYASESEEGAKLSEALIKDVTGGVDHITGRHPYGEPFSFRPLFKLWLGTNHEPVIHGTDPAIWRRPRKIPFTVSFDGREDKELFDKLCLELPGILRWAVKGCLLWQESGLEPPKAVKDATNAYRQAMDIVGRFLEERCTIKPFAKVESTRLYQAYNKWCDDNGETALSQRKLAERLHERGLHNDTRSATTDRVQWTGIGL